MIQRVLVFGNESMDDAPMTQPIKFKVAGPEKGLELISLIARRMKLSRNEAKRHIDSRQVFINDQRIWMARHAVSSGDVIEIHGLPEKDDDNPIGILWQDDHYVIVNKPSGWLANGPGSIEERLQKEQDRGVFAVHRLDRETSGCMLLAWTRADMELMIPVFQRREVKKVYEGLVIGKIPPDWSVINRTVEGEEAVTLVKVLRRKQQFSRVEFTLVTGRTHQIRRHLTACGLHLAGEKKYGATTLEKPVLRNLQRHMLHATILGFPHPHTEAFIQAKAPLPADYREAAKLLGL
jgi:RluA family pseudouridine synthase